MGRFGETAIGVTESLDKYDAFSASGLLEKFVDDFSLWYIRRSRDRVGPAAESEKEREDFYMTTWLVLTNLVKVLAPFQPFMAEIIAANLIPVPSIHLVDWPSNLSLTFLREAGHYRGNVMADMQKARELVEKIHAARKQAGIPVRQPLKSYATTAKTLPSDYEELIKAETNVKGIFWGDKQEKLDIKLYPELEEETKTRELVRRIQSERKEKGLSLGQKVSVTNPWLPKDQKLENWLKKKAQVTELTQGEFNVKTV